MVAALRLAQAGVPVLVLEAGADLAMDSKASTFHIPSLELLDTLGITLLKNWITDTRFAYPATTVSVAVAIHLIGRTDRLIDGVLEQIPQSWCNGDRTQRLAGNANLGFACMEAESLLLLLDQHGICASSGSACTSGSIEPSHVLLAMGLTSEAANGSLRFSLGRETSADDIERVLQVLPGMIARLRNVVPCDEALAV